MTLSASKRRIIHPGRQGMSKRLGDDRGEHGFERKFIPVSKWTGSEQVDRVPGLTLQEKRAIFNRKGGRRQQEDGGGATSLTDSTDVKDEHSGGHDRTARTVVVVIREAMPARIYHRGRAQNVGPGCHCRVPRQVGPIAQRTFIRTWPWRAGMT